VRANEATEGHDEKNRPKDLEDNRERNLSGRILQFRDFFFSALSLSL
jgi:hypothetical protein